MAGEEIVAFQNSDYPKGAIRKLIFHDFLTYNHVEVLPGPSMNVIIGPNGTGKSTIICGICLASGGSPKYLGRSDKMGDFIRHGKMEGFVEMYLKDDDESNGIKRFKIVIKKPHSASYYINESRVTHAEHLKAIEAYNIQVGNPCTFLAQDKVKSFAEQNPQLLLRNTEKAGAPELIELHEQLEEKFKDGSAMGNRKQAFEEQLRRLRDDISRVLPMATSYLESQRRNAHIQTFRAKKHFLMYEAAEKKYHEQQSETKTAHEAVKLFDTQKAVVNSQIAEYKDFQRRLNVEAVSSRHHETRKNVIQLIQRIRGSFETNAISNARREYNNTKALHDSWEKEYQNIQALVKQLEGTLETLRANPPDRSILDQKENEFNRMRQEFSKEEVAIESDFRDLMMRKREIENRKNSRAHTFRSRLQYLAQRENNEGIIRAWDYYVQNKDKFKYPVYVPYIFVSTKDKYTIYLNNSFGRRDISMFIFGCREDEAIIQQQRFNVNSTVMSPEMIAQHSQCRPLDRGLTKYGFFDYVSNLYNAPDAVKAYFNSVNRLNTIPVGNAETDRDCEAVGARIKDQIGVFLTNRTRVQVITSKYSSNVTVGRNPLKTDGLIGSSHTSEIRTDEESTDAIDVKLRQVQDRRNAFGGRKVEIDRVRAEVADLRRQYQHDMDEIVSIEQRYQKAKRQEQSYSRGKPNLEEARRALEECEKIAKEQIPKELESCVKALADYKKGTDDFSICTLEHRRYMGLIAISLMDIDEIDQNAAESVEKYKEAKKSEESLKETFLNARKELKDVTGITTTKLEKLVKEDHKQIFNELLKKFEEYKVPETIEECEDEIRQEELRAQVGNLRGSKEDVKSLANLQKQEEVLVEELQKHDNTIQNWEGDMAVLLEKWLTPLEALVKKISTNFEHFFTKIGCLGEVRLFKPANKLKIDEYGIEIYVRFRSYNQLRRLTAQQQSGGERSVSTMLYLMALQELCPVPFRCVDEINQGMDPTNERMVFNMMVELLSGKTGHLAHTQYFMLTPKLLPGLKFTEKVAVLIIHNSATMDRGSDLLNIPNAPYELTV